MDTFAFLTRILTTEMTWNIKYKPITAKDSYKLPIKNLETVFPTLIHEHLNCNLSREGWLENRDDQSQ